MDVSLLNGTVFDYSGEIFYFHSLVDPTTYSFAFGLCFMLTVLLTSLLGCSIYSPDIDHDNEFFGTEEGPQWNLFSAYLRRKKKKRKFIHIVWGCICVYLLYMTYASHLYSKSQDILTDIQEEVYQSNLSCTENPDVTCCSYYDQCREGDSGPMGLMDATTYIISNYKEGGNADCPDISYIIDKRDKLLNLQWSVPCAYTKYGCCDIQSMCNYYIHQGELYSTFHSSELLLYHQNRGKIHTYLAKVDAEGSNCDDESVRSLLMSYAMELYTRIPRDEGGSSNFVSYDYLPKHMQYATFIMIGFTGISSVIGYFTFKKDTHDILESDDENWSAEDEPKP